jgi:bacillithiol biosynthesis cysteine-adding enzyme BshC
MSHPGDRAGGRIRAGDRAGGRIHRIPIGDLPSTTPLFVDLWTGARGYRGLVPRHFLEPGALAAQRAVLAAGRYDRAALSAVLREQNEHLGAGPAALAACGRLAHPDAVVVIGGQQAGLFGGPLYTAYKALTILRLARRAEDELGVPVVPVFWIASEDSDIAEIDHTWLTDRAGDLVHLRLPTGGPDKVPVSRIRLGEGIGTLLEQAAEALPASGYAGETMDALRAAYEPGRTFPAAFGSWMAWLFREQGLVLVDPSDDRLKRMVMGLFESEIMDHSPVSAAVIEQTARLRAAGYEPQIELRDGLLTLFYQDPARDAIALKDGTFELKASGRRMRAEELRDTLRGRPDAFTPNAVLRPLFQDSLFPTLAVVLGPSEIAYYTQLTIAYERMGVVMPLLWPRASLTIVEEKSEKLREKLDVGLLDLIARGERVIDDVLRRKIPPALTERIETGRARSAETWAGVLDEIDRLDPTLHRTAQIAAARSAFPFDFMERKIAQAARRKNDVLRSQVRRLVNALAPRGGLQERTLCALRFLAQRGPGVLDEIAAAIDPSAPEHRALVVQS